MHCTYWSDFSLNHSEVFSNQKKFFNLQNAIIFSNTPIWPILRWIWQIFQNLVSEKASSEMHVERRRQDFSSIYTTLLLPLHNINSQLQHTSNLLVNMTIHISSALIKIFEHYFHNFMKVHVSQMHLDLVNWLCCETEKMNNKNLNLFKTFIM